MTPEEVMAAVGWAPDDDKTPAAESTPEEVFHNGADGTKKHIDILECEWLYEAVDRKH